MEGERSSCSFQISDRWQRRGSITEEILSVFVVLHSTVRTISTSSVGSLVAFFYPSITPCECVLVCGCVDIRTCASRFDFMTPLFPSPLVSV